MSVVWDYLDEENFSGRTSQIFRENLRRNIFRSPEKYQKIIANAYPCQKTGVCLDLSQRLIFNKSCTR